MTSQRLSGREMCGRRWLQFVSIGISNERRYVAMLDRFVYLDRSRISGAPVLPSSAHPPTSPLGEISKEDDRCSCGTFMHRMVPTPLHHILWWLHRQVRYQYRHRLYPQVRKYLALSLSSLGNRFFEVGAPFYYYGNGPVFVPYAELVTIARLLLSVVTGVFGARMKLLSTEKEVLALSGRA